MNIFTICSLYIHSTFTSYSLYIHYIFTIYSLYIHYIFTICSLYFHYMFNICSLLVALYMNHCILSLLFLPCSSIMICFPKITFPINLLIIKQHIVIVAQQLPILILQEEKFRNSFGGHLIIYDQSSCVVS